MKKIKYITILCTAFFLTLVSCESDNEFLKEVRKDGLTTDNAYLSKPQFEMLSGAMYYTLQDMYNAGDGYTDTWYKGFGMDVFFDTRGDELAYNDWGKVNSFSGDANRWYNWQYGIIKNANTVIDAAQKEGVKWNSEEEKNAIIAEGRFFRAFAYRNLANVFGGVPIVDTPITEPKVDFVRNTREECWEFAKKDLEFAKTHLYKATDIKGRVVKAAADHLLAEINICLKDWDGAIAAASRVIDGNDGNYALMTGRFGKRSNEAGKNIYWDLFRMGNQDYQDGNTEAIWTAQFEYNTPGGTVRFGRPLSERIFWCNYWDKAKFGYSGGAKDSTGRGVAFVRGTNYSNYTIWQDAENDMRNSETCIKRKYYFGGDVAEYKKGDLIPKSYLTAREDTIMHVFPNWFKFGTDKHLDGKPDNGYVRDFYVMRLSETYLLRAEAYLGKGQKDKAADDINVIRTRAEAPHVEAGNVDIDYILDERARELYGEEYRTLTLGRLGLIYDRTKRFGWAPARVSIKEHNNLFPIPQSVIDRNVGHKLQQNPGYE